MRKGVFAVAIGMLAGCGGEAPIQPTAFDVSTKNERVTASLPSIRQACPGLDRYAGSFQGIRIEEQFRTTIVFDISKRNAIPARYEATGHTCFIEIDNDESAIFIEKNACKSVCLDKLEVPDGQLRISLTPRK